MNNGTTSFESSPVLSGDDSSRIHREKWLMAQTPQIPTQNHQSALPFRRVTSSRRTGRLWGRLRNAASQIQGQAWNDGYPDVRLRMVSLHTARRTFITNVYLSGKFSIEFMMKLSGHTKYETFKRYVRLSLDEYAEDIAKSAENCLF